MFDTEAWKEAGLAAEPAALQLDDLRTAAAAASGSPARSTVAFRASRNRIAPARFAAAVLPALQRLVEIDVPALMVAVAGVQAAADQYLPLVQALLPEPEPEE